MSQTAELESTELDSIAAEDLALFSSREKQLESQRLRDEIEAYLARGGMIRQIPTNTRADPPKRPQSNYGGQPI